VVYFFDLDGVVIDSIEECYVVSKGLYFEHSEYNYDNDKYKEIFYKHRGLVKPAYEYLVLHKSIEKYLSNTNLNFENIFVSELNNTNEQEKLDFEKNFFCKRSKFIENEPQKWLSMNKLTKFGKKLKSNCYSPFYIITTKNFDATIFLLKHYKICPVEIFTNNDIKKFGSKGSLISKFLDKENISKAFFIDDAVEHLDSVNDERIDCYFAHWGYGKNTNFRIFNC